MAACVVGDLTRHPSSLGRVGFASYLDPPAHRSRVQSLQGPPRRVPAQIYLAGLLRNYTDLRAGQRVAVGIFHGREQVLELLVDGPGQVPAPLGGENVHEAALDPALLALGGLEPVYGIVELSPPTVDERGQLLHLRVGPGTFGPGLITRRAHRLVGVLGPDDGPLLRFSLSLGFAQLPLERLYRRGHSPFPPIARLHDHSTARRTPT